MNYLIDKNEKIFIAGASGMAGRAIYNSLVKKGYGKSINKGKLLIPTHRELDLLSLESIKKWFSINKPSIVIIAAAKVGGILANKRLPAEFILENLKIQTNLIETSFKFEVKRLLFLGSSCIYPKFASQPIKEDYLLTGALESTNEYYAIAKIAGIKLCEALRKEYKFDAISLMPTNLYGPGDNYDLENSHVMAALIRKFVSAKKNSDKSVTCWGTGNPMREFMYVDDLGDAVVHALEFWDPENEYAPLDDNGKPLLYLNVGTGYDISIKDLSNKIANICQYKGTIKWDRSKPDGTPKKKLDIRKFKQLGWTPKINLETGIKKTILSFKLDHKP
tara:strand:+ start:2681 stop:3682 length:1002 start_codon:yes stop_codon:yes gene_type:complete